MDELSALPSGLHELSAELNALADLFPVESKHQTVGSGHASSEQQLHSDSDFSSAASSALGPSLTAVSSKAAPASAAAVHMDAFSQFSAWLCPNWRS